ncbi:hypothetical protein IC621_22150 [Bacillus sp. IB182487]|uniref:PTS EIIA type-4 domain-containing protein n=1 Tax=Metabacillus arenae TaxID=2771434 RepID=A0A926RYG5_9BACI|nr:hypothetical protein [Metabacillus arenae]MBD1382908.1 hypothetical protein [Metabacillus arenae]
MYDFTLSTKARLFKSVFTIKIVLYRTSFDKINNAISENDANEIFAFYDLGSAKMNLEMVMELTDKKIHLMDTALAESAYTTAALIQADASFDTIMAQLKPLKIK